MYIYTFSSLQNEFDSTTEPILDNYADHEQVSYCNILLL